MTRKQETTLKQIKDKWESKGRGIYINRKNQRVIYNLYNMGLVKIYPYCMEFGNMAYPAEVCKCETEI